MYSARMGWGGVGPRWPADASERDIQVFTPPRDDPATRPRFLVSPRRLDERGAEHPTRVATRQACKLTLTAFGAFLAILAAVSILYFLGSAMFGTLEDSCGEQRIPHGTIAAGVENSTAQVRCDKGFVLAPAPRVEFMCQVIQSLCIVAKQATLAKEEGKCEAAYAFATYELGKEARANQAHEEVDPYFMRATLEEHAAQVRNATSDAAAGTCVPAPPGMNVAAGSPTSLDSPLPSRLFRQGAPVAPAGSGVGGPRALPSWVSALCMLSLVFVALGSVVVSGIRRACDGGIPPGGAPFASARRRASDSTSLLDASDEEDGGAYVATAVGVDGALE